MSLAAQGVANLRPNFLQREEVRGNRKVDHVHHPNRENTPREQRLVLVLLVGVALDQPVQNAVILRIHHGGEMLDAVDFGKLPIRPPQFVHRANRVEQENADSLAMELVDHDHRPLGSRRVIRVHEVASGAHTRIARLVENDAQAVMRLVIQTSEIVQFFLCERLLRRSETHEQGI